MCVLSIPKNNFREDFILMSFAPADIPGMIEPIEQGLLYDLARNIELRPKSKIIEFGAFFGRSSKCLLDGIRANNSIVMHDRSSPPLRVIDSFQCHPSGSFRVHVESFARQGQVAHLLNMDSDSLSFRNIFDFYTLSDTDLMKVSEMELEDTYHDGAGIGLMHIDLPKFWNEYRLLINRFFLWCDADCEIVFQDFFYHWSATLIKPIFIWIKDGIFEPVSTAASSLHVRLRRKITSEDIRKLEHAMAETDDAKVIQECRKNLAEFDIDRKDYFLNRLLLAQLQQEFEEKRYSDAQTSFRLLFESKTINVPGIYTDLLDLIGNGFSIRSLYDLDHHL